MRCIWIVFVCLAVVVEKAAAGAVRDEKAGEAVEEERLMVRRVVVRPRREALPRWAAANADMLDGRELRGRKPVGWRSECEAGGRRLRRLRTRALLGGRWWCDSACGV
jgi:hypothetical protein